MLRYKLFISADVSVFQYVVGLDISCAEEVLCVGAYCRVFFCSISKLDTLMNVENIHLECCLVCWFVLFVFNRYQCSV